MAHEKPEPAEHFEQLSVPARRAWGKHDRDTESWLPLWRHMSDSASVAGRLWDEWIPANVKGLVAENLPGGADDARRLAIWLAAGHDIGKATPAFSCQVDSLASDMREAGLEMPYEKQFGADRKRAPHGLAGQLILQEWLADVHGRSGRASGQFAIVIGGHHGIPPAHQDIHDVDLHPELLRTPGASDETWRAVQFELLGFCARLADVEGRIDEWKSVKLPQPVQVILTAVVILADWIASSAELFPYESASLSSGGVGGHSARLEAAWRGLDLPSPWAPAEQPGAAADLFASRFPLPPGAEARPVQEEAVRLAREMPASGLLIIEAPMGEGKTEAALAAAEILAARTGAGGCLVALPTRATGDAMFSRLLSWLDRLPSAAGGSVFLAHAKAALNDEWSGLLRAGSRPIAAVDIALFGRMVADAADLNVEAATQVAHALSVHATDTESDYYTAVDDKNTDAESGAGMIGTVDFNSATLYRYAALDVNALHENLGAGLREEEPSSEPTRRAVEAFLEGFVTSLPTGKINSFGNHTLPSVVMVKLRTKRPISFVASFEKPVLQGDSGGFLRASCARLAREVPDLERAYGVADDENTWLMRVGEDTEPLIGLGSEVPLDELVKAAAAEAVARLESRA